MLCNVNVKLL